MGKDVVSFLSWAAEPEMEERKLVNKSFKTLQNYEKIKTRLAFPFAFYYKKLKRKILLRTNGLISTLQLTLI